MKIDMALLEKDSAPTIAELKAFFRGHDFSTQISKFDPMTASEEQNRVYSTLLWAGATERLQRRIEATKHPSTMRI